MDKIEDLLEEAQKKANEVKEDFVKDTPVFSTRVKEYFNKYKTVISSIALWLAVGTIGYEVFLNNTTFTSVETPKEIIKTDKVDDKVINPIPAPANVGVVESVAYKVIEMPKDVAVFKDGNYIALDLSKMAKVKEVTTTNSFNKKEMLGLSYALEMSMPNRKDTSVYLTYYTDK